MTRRAVRFIRPSFVLCVVLAVALVLGAGGRSPVSAQTPPSEDASALRELVQRLLTPPYHIPSQPAHSVELLPGALPSRMPVEIALPAGGRLIGSIVISSGDTRANIQTIADVAQSGRAVAEYYRAQFSAAGWVAPSYGPPPRGFQQAPALSLQQTYCKQGAGFVHAAVFEREDATAEVRMTFQLDTPAPTPVAAVPPCQ